jgi:hypothetical protein
MAPMTAGLDDLVAETSVDLVGYGLTEDGGTTLRHRLSLPIHSVTAIRVTFDQATGGTCAGDSGGAVVRRIADTDYLAGIPRSRRSSASTIATARPI